jgi:hypothetical protein
LTLPFGRAAAALAALVASMPSSSRMICIAVKYRENVRSLHSLMSWREKDLCASLGRPGRRTVVG